MYPELTSQLQPSVEEGKEIASKDKASEVAREIDQRKAVESDGSSTEYIVGKNSNIISLKKRGRKFPKKAT